MSTSAKRRGLDPDPERELRFRRIEEALDLRARSNPNISEANQRRVGASVPQVTGVTLNTGIIGGLGVSWSASEISDVEYEVQYSTDAAFTSPTSIKTQTLETTLSSLSATDTIYVRVRALNSRGEPGNWSDPQNSASGKASADNLQAGAATTIVNRTKTAGLAVLTHTGGPIGTVVDSIYIPTTVNFPEAADVFIFGVTKGTFAQNINDLLTAKILVDGSAKIDYENSTSLGPTNGTFTVPGLTIPIRLEAGQHTFSFYLSLTVGSNNLSTFTPTNLSLAVWRAVR